MKLNYHIKNGRVIDPSRGIDQIGDIYVKGSKIVALPEGVVPEVDETIDATGCIVLPGLIDFHTHLDKDHSELGIHPDLMTLPSGITAAVDAGSTGSTNFEGFYKDVVCSSNITMKSFINVSAVGIITEQYNENPDPSLYDIDRITYMFERYSDHLLGLKVRIGKLFSKEFNLEPLKKTRELARMLNTNMCVHAVHPESPYDEILSHFDKGDILCHCFQAKGPYNILDSNGKIPSYVKDARSRGVIFDGASGRANYSFDVAQKAILDGFLPDVISTDVVTFSIYKPKVFSLLYTMSAYVAMGMPLNEVIRAVTETPANLMHLKGYIGTLAPSALADIAILKIREKPITFKDQFGNLVEGNQLFIPQMTIKAGRTAFMQIDFQF